MSRMMVRTDLGIVPVEKQLPRDVVEGDRVVRYAKPGSLTQTVRPVLWVLKVRTSWGSTQYTIQFDGEDRSYRFTPNSKLMVVARPS